MYHFVGGTNQILRFRVFYHCVWSAQVFVLIESSDVGELSVDAERRPVREALRSLQVAAHALAHLPPTLVCVCGYRTKFTFVTVHIMLKMTAWFAKKNCSRVCSFRPPSNKIRA